MPKSMCLRMPQGDSWPPTPEDIPEPSHGRVFREKFRSVYVVKGIWSLLTDLFFNRRYCVLESNWAIFYCTRVTELRILPSPGNVVRCKSALNVFIMFCVLLFIMQQSKLKQEKLSPPIRRMIVWVVAPPPRLYPHCLLIVTILPLMLLRVPATNLYR